MSSLILEKGRHKVTRCEVTLDAERAETDPKVFTKIRFHFKVAGKGLTRDVVERAIKLSAEKILQRLYHAGQDGRAIA